ncbi:DUF5789 family protein [Natronobeatus ordinarius]|uniref:DUF5789 family protein n=1 Tax=Natronobeatus ordinarius TaxID=2963433 RepID=UPI0020CE2DAB|nr:hypothetical protein [Natronobeatus ordinarius]
MGRQIKLSRVETTLEELDYPVTRAQAVDGLEDVTLLLADGEANLGDVVSRTGSETYASRDELVGEVFNVLPRRAVGEPFQSEGEG